MPRQARLDAPGNSGDTILMCLRLGISGSPFDPAGPPIRDVIQDVASYDS